MSAQKDRHAARQVILEILVYLTSHPDAKDTLEGIIRWWCPRSGSERGREEVQEVLDFLVSRGWLTERETIPEQKLYGMSKDREKDIKRFLKATEHEEWRDQ